MKLPEPKYTVTDPEGRHRYRIEQPDGPAIDNLMSVTGVLDVISKPALYQWYARMACEQIERRLLEVAGQNVQLTPAWIAEVVAEGRKRPKVVKDEAAQLGTAAHAAFETLIKGEIPVVLPEIAPAIDEFRRWFGQTKTAIVAQEVMVASAEHKFGGRFDALGERDGKMGILEWKSAAAVYPEFALQTAGGYTIAVEEQYPGIKIEWVDIARFPKKAPWSTEIFPVANMAAARDGFMAALALTRSLKADLIGAASYSTFAENIPAQKAPAAAAPKKKSASSLGF